MTTRVDTCGLSCPQPVILSKNAIKKGAFPIEVFVDTTTSCENVRRMAENNGCIVKIEDRNGEFTVILNKP